MPQSPLYDFYLKMREINLNLIDFITLCILIVWFLFFCVILSQNLILQIIYVNFSWFYFQLFLPEHLAHTNKFDHNQPKVSISISSAIFTAINQLFIQHKPQHLHSYSSYTRVVENEIICKKKLTLKQTF